MSNNFCFYLPVFKIRKYDTSRSPGVPDINWAERSRKDRVKPLLPDLGNTSVGSVEIAFFIPFLVNTERKTRILMCFPPIN